MCGIKKPIGPGRDTGAGTGEEEPANIDQMLVAGISRGLTKTDTESMTMGMWTDYIIEWNNMHAKADDKYKQSHDSKGRQVTTRQASQSDFDTF